MALYDEIKAIRTKLGLRVTEFARRLGISPTHVTVIEKPPKKGERIIIPSVELLRKIAFIAASTPAERKAIERKLLIERAKLMNPEIKGFFEGMEDYEKKYTAPVASMPPAFIKRLKGDLDRVAESGSQALDKVYKQIPLTREELKNLLEGKLIVDRRTVISLALNLNQPVEEYLLLAEYIPENLKNVISRSREKAYVFFRKLSQLSDKDIDQLLDAFERVLNVFLGVKDGTTGDRGAGRKAPQGIGDPSKPEKGD